MQYSLTWGRESTDDRIAKAAKEEGYAIPKTVTQKPRVELYEKLYWDCFMDLCGTRTIGTVLGWIPWTAIDSWATRYGVTDADEFEILKKVVMQLDGVWMEHFKTKRETD